MYLVSVPIVSRSSGSWLSRVLNLSGSVWIRIRANYSHERLNSRIIRANNSRQCKSGLTPIFSFCLSGVFFWRSLQPRLRESYKEEYATRFYEEYAARFYVWEFFSVCHFYPAGWLVGWRPECYRCATRHQWWWSLVGWLIGSLTAFSAQTGQTVFVNPKYLCCSSSIDTWTGTDGPIQGFVQIVERPGIKVTFSRPGKSWNHIVP